MTAQVKNGMLNLPMRLLGTETKRRLMIAQVKEMLNLPMKLLGTETKRRLMIAQVKEMLNLPMKLPGTEIKRQLMIAQVKNGMLNQKLSLTQRSNMLNKNYPRKYILGRYTMAITGKKGILLSALISVRPVRKWFFRTGKPKEPLRFRSTELPVNPIGIWSRQGCLSMRTEA
jgi:hypothetical protein